MYNYYPKAFLLKGVLRGGYSFLIEGRRRMDDRG